MQSELRPDRSHVVFATDEYVDGPFRADDPWLHVYVDPDWPDAWRKHLPQYAIRTFIERGGSIIVHIGTRWRSWSKGIMREGVGDIELGRSLGMFRPSHKLPKEFPEPTFDADELVRRT